jgi:hypothetical protein
MEKIISFQIDVKGEVTGTRYEGLFKAKTSLTYRDMLKQDQVRRAVLGPDGDQAGALAQSIAQATAFLAVHLVESPNWWSQQGSGLDVVDVNILTEVNNACFDAVEKEKEKLRSAGEAAKKVLEEKVKEA